MSGYPYPAEAQELAPGDAAIFGCFLPHRSAPNRSQCPTARS